MISVIIYFEIRKIKPFKLQRVFINSKLMAFLNILVYETGILDIIKLLNNLDVFLHYMFFANGLIKNMSLVFLERTKFSCFSMMTYYFSSKAAVILPNSKIWIISLKIFMYVHSKYYIYLIKNVSILINLNRAINLIFVFISTIVLEV